jgi:hypothetical protein
MEKLNNDTVKIVDDILDDLTQDMYENYIKMTTAIKREDYIEAASIRDLIDITLYNTNTMLYGLTSIDMKDKLIQQKEFVHKQVEKNYDNIIKSKFLKRK